MDINRIHGSHQHSTRWDSQVMMALVGHFSLVHFKQSPTGVHWVR